MRYGRLLAARAVHTYDLALIQAEYRPPILRAFELLIEVRLEGILPLASLTYLEYMYI